MNLHLKVAILFLFPFSILTAQEIQIGGQTWMKYNLGVTQFRNGDKILHAMTKEEWIQACENNVPAWCYYDNESFSVYHYGKLYNRSAVQDPRGLAPEGWRIPSMEDYKMLVKTYQQTLEKLPKTDTAKYIREMHEVKELFKSTENDSLFASKYRNIDDSNEPIRVQVPLAENIYASYSSIPRKAIHDIENTTVGNVEGPYINANEISIYKVIDQKPVEYATARHILLRVSGDEDRSKYHQRADSIIKVIRNKGNFEEMVTLYSEDPASIDKGGVYAYFPKKVMVEPFDYFSFQQPVGTLGKVESIYGIHIIEVLKRETIKRPIVIPIKKYLAQTYDLTHFVAGDGDHSSEDIIYFDAAPGGYRTPDGQFMKGGIQSVLWTSSLVDGWLQVFLSAIYGIDVSMGSTDQNMGFSVRCIR